MADVDITSLSVEISAESQGAELNIDKLATAISNLRTKGNVTKVVNSLDRLAGSIAALKQASAGMSGLDKITSFLNGLSNVNTTASAKSINTVVNAIKKIPAAVSGLNGVDFYSMSGSITQLTNALAPLSILDASSLKALGSAFNAIGKVPDLTDKLKATDLDSFASSCQKISTALTPLASQLDKVGNAFANLPPQLSKVVTQANRVTAANEKQRKSYLSLSNQMNGFMRNMAKLVSLKAIADYLGNAVAKFNDFYEATDLFHNAMGNLSGEADTLISKMQGLLGVDPTKAMTYMATIQSLGTSFGLTSDKAYVLSKNLTQLAYDEASYWNKDAAETFTAMSSAISGEIEPIRRLGVDLTQARLQQELLALGFNKQVSSLSQADKAVLRYIAIMKQTTNIQGNLAQTINSPANQIKILKAQLDMLAKSVGSLLYPALKSILPPLIAAVQLIREFVEWVAKLMGVKVVFTDFTKSADSVGGIGDAMDDTADSTKKAAKALKDYTMGFDELNIIDPTQGSSGSGSGASAGNILGDVDLSGYDMFKDYVGTSVDEIKAKFESLKGVIAAIGLSLAGLSLAKFLTSVGEAITKMGTLEKLMASIATFTIEAVLVYKFEDAYAKTGNIADLIMSWVTTGIASYIGYKAWGPAGAIIGLTISYLMTMKAQHDNLSSGNESFGDARTWISLLNQGLKGLAVGIGVSVMTPFGVGAAAAALTGFSVAALIAFEVDLATIKDKLSQYPIMEKISKIVENILLAGVIAGAALVLGATAGVAGVAAVATIAIKIGFDLIFGNTDKNDDSGVDAMSGADAGVDKGLAQFETSVGKRIEETKQWWNDRWDGFKENIGKSWDSLKNFAADYWENNSLIHGLIEQTKQNVSDLKETLGTIREAFNQKVKDIEESAANAGKAAAEWVNGVLSKFREKRDEFFNAGKNLIQGFIEGIKNLKEQAISSVTGIATSAVDKFKTLLGIHSPSTVFAEIGGYIDQGLANGITAAIPYVTTAMQGVVDAVQEKGQALIDAGSAHATGYVNNFLDSLDTEWQHIDQSLQADFFGSINTLWEAISNGDLEKLGTWAASYFYHAMDDEQRKQIKSIANNSLQWLTQGLSSVWNNIAGMASSFIGQFVPSAVAATSAQTSLNIAMDANPVMLVISLIGMLVGALVNFANKNKSVSTFLQNIWYGVGDFFSIIFEGILRIIGTAVQGFVDAINALIWAWNKVPFHDKMGYVSNPMYDWADKVAKDRAESQRKRQEAANSSFDDSKDPTNYEQQYKELLEKYKDGSYPGTKEWDKNNGTSSGSYGGTTSVNVNINEEEMRESVYNGTYNAFLDIFQRYGDELTGGKELKIYLDGKQITASVEKRQNARGQSLMGSEVYSY